MNGQTSKAESNFIQFKKGRIHYLKFGTGPKAMVALHGFSEEAKSYLELQSVLSEKYTVFSIDFPYHGKTEWPMGEEFNRSDMSEVLEMLFVKENVDQFSLFGFSMGGRISLSIYPLFLTRIDQIFLAAPDGIKTQKVFDVAVYPAWGRWLFRMVSRKPGLFFFILKLLYKRGRITKFMYEFTTNHMDTSEKRERIFYTWITLKNFSPEISRIKEILNKNQTPIHLFFGERDQVIKPKVGKYFQRGLHHCTLDIVPKGHKLIHPVLAPYLKPYL